MQLECLPFFHDKDFIFAVFEKFNFSFLNNLTQFCHFIFDKNLSFKMSDFWEKFVSLATMKSPDADYMRNKKRFRRKRMNNYQQDLSPTHLPEISR